MFVSFLIVHPFCRLVVNFGLGERMREREGGRKGDGTDVL